MKKNKFHKKEPEAMKSASNLMEGSFIRPLSSMIDYLDLSSENDNINNMSQPCNSAYLALKSMSMSNALCYEALKENLKLCDKIHQLSSYNKYLEEKYFGGSSIDEIILPKINPSDANFISTPQREREIENVYKYSYNTYAIYNSNGRDEVDLSGEYGSHDDHIGN